MKQAQFNTATTTSTQKPTTSLFGNLAGGTTGTEKPGGLGFGSTGIFGTKPTETASAAPATSSNLFGAKPAETPAATPNLFGGAKPAETSSTASTLFGSKPAETSSAAQSLFGAKPGETASATPNLFAAKPANTATATTNLFGAKPAENTSTATGASANLFGNSNLFGKPAASLAATPTPGAPTTASTTQSPFPGLGAGLLGSKPGEKKDSLPAAPTGLNLGTLKPDDKTSPAVVAKAPSQEGTKLNASSAATSVAVQPPSLLRGKTIEEIVNKWTADLETHVTEFNKFAGEVAAWDRALIENGNNLAALFSHVQAAQRDQDEVDQSLDHIEQQQRDLAATLDTYEKVTQEIFGSQGGGLRALDSGPADTERDKNYMLATDLHNHLEDLSSSLTEMIETVNSLSQTAGPENATDDPMAQIAQILSSHLESLQWIDGAVRDVETKVSEVERRVKESSTSPTPVGQKPRGFALR